MTLGGMGASTWLYSTTSKAEAVWPFNLITLGYTALTPTTPCMPSKCHPQMTGQYTAPEEWGSK